MTVGSSSVSSRKIKFKVLTEHPAVHQDPIDFVSNLHADGTLPIKNILKKYRASYHIQHSEHLKQSFDLYCSIDPNKQRLGEEVSADFIKFIDHLDPELLKCEEPEIILAIVPARKRTNSELSSSPVEEGVPDLFEQHSDPKALTYYSGPYNFNSYSSAMPYNSYTSGYYSSYMTKEKNCNFAGLINSGTTCYMNSLIQTLFMTPEFRNTLYKWQYEMDGDSEEAKICIPYQLQKLFLHMQTTKQGAVSTDGLTTSFGWNNSDIFQQQDVQELCRVLFDAIEVMLKKNGPTDDDHHNFINRLYSGKRVHFVKCLQCGHESCQNEDFLDIQVPIQPFELNAPCFNNLRESLKAMLKTERLDSNNQYDCEKCKQKTDAERGTAFRELPYLLTFQLMRFTFDRQTFNRVKLDDNFQFDLDYCDMSELVNLPGKQQQEDSSRCSSASSRACNNSSNTSDYCSSSFSGSSTGNGADKSSRDESPLFDDDESVDHGIGSEENQNTVSSLSVDASSKNGFIQRFTSMMGGANQQPKKRPEGDHMYELFSIMVHTGHMNSGHYYAYIKDFDSKQWFQFNDQRVSSASYQDLQGAFGGHRNSANAYFLIYRRIDATLNESFMQIEQFPCHLQRMLQQMREHDEREQIRKAREKLKVYLCVHHNQCDRQTIEAYRDQTMEEVTKLVLQELKLQTQVALTDARLIHTYGYYVLESAESICQKKYPQIKAEEANLHVKLGDFYSEAPNYYYTCQSQNFLLETVKNRSVPWPVYKPQGSTHDLLVVPDSWLTHENFPAELACDQRLLWLPQDCSWHEFSQIMRFRVGVAPEGEPECFTIFASPDISKVYSVSSASDASVCLDLEKMKTGFGLVDQLAKAYRRRQDDELLGEFRFYVRVDSRPLTECEIRRCKLRIFFHSRLNCAQLNVFSPEQMHLLVRILQPRTGLEESQGLASEIDDQESMDQDSATDQYTCCDLCKTWYNLKLPEGSMHSFDRQQTTRHVSSKTDYRENNIGLYPLLSNGSLKTNENRSVSAFHLALLTNGSYLSTERVVITHVLKVMNLDPDIAQLLVDNKVIQTSSSSLKNTRSRLTGNVLSFDIAMNLKPSPYCSQVNRVTMPILDLEGLFDGDKLRLRPRYANLWNRNTPAVDSRPKLFADQLLDLYIPKRISTQEFIKLVYAFFEMLYENFTELVPQADCLRLFEFGENLQPKRLFGPNSYVVQDHYSEARLLLYMSSKPEGSQSFQPIFLCQWLCDQGQFQSHIGLLNIAECLKCNSPSSLWHWIFDKILQSSPQLSAERLQICSVPFPGLVHRQLLHEAPVFENNEQELDSIVWYPVVHTQPEDPAIADCTASGYSRHLPDIYPNMFVYYRDAGLPRVEDSQLTGLSMERAQMLDYTKAQAFYSRYMTDAVSKYYVASDEDDQQADSTNKKLETAPGGTCSSLNGNNSNESKQIGGLGRSARGNLRIYTVENLKTSKDQPPATGNI